MCLDATHRLSVETQLPRAAKWFTIAIAMGASTSRDDPITAIEAVYDLEGNEEAWMRRILNALAPSLDEGFGLVGQTYDLLHPDGPQIGPVNAIGAVATQHDVPVVLTTALGREGTIRLLRWCGGRTVSQHMGLKPHEFVSHPAFRDAWHGKGYKDFLALNSCDVSGRGAYVGAPLEEAQWLSGMRARRWMRVSSHFATALRLRRALTGDPFEASDAVMTPGGRVEHAERDATEKSARDALRAAAIAIDRARGPTRKKPDEALALWMPLVTGRWSIVDRFDRDGRRFLIALRNEPRLDDPRALTPRERLVVAFAALGHTNKVIAYDLGMSTSRVGTCLASAARKLGAGSRVELITLVSSLAEQSVRED
jgi:DNA-binding CsgD family transcriptional regulator